MKKINKYDFFLFGKKLHKLQFENPRIKIIMISYSITLFV